MKKVLENARELIGNNEERIRELIPYADSDISFYRASIHKVQNAIVALAKDSSSKFLMVLADKPDGVMAKFDGEQIGDNGIFAKKCGLNEANAEVIRGLFPWTNPVSLRKKKTTIGCGDRLGLASPGHIASASAFQISPVLAQQSIRELKLTGRTYRNVVDDACFGVLQAGFKDGFGADGDHLKTIAHINMALAAGMPMITLDLSDEMQPEAGSWSESEVQTAFANLPEAVRKYTEATYFDKTFTVGKAAIKIDKITAMRCALMYNRALDFAAVVDKHLHDHRGEEYDLEISIDETSSPTLPEHHYYISSELRVRKVSVSSLAPRFIGEFQKAIDYIGDLNEFAKQFEVHAEIAKVYGYKLSIHSGSDKFAVYPCIGSMTEHRVHVKTAGTSWLEAVKVISHKDPVLFRVMTKCAFKNLSEMLKLYHITADFSKVPDVDKLYDEELPKLLETREGRQLLHISFGPILSEPSIRPIFFSVMRTNEKTYYDYIKAHFDKHISLLGVAKSRHECL